MDKKILVLIPCYNEEENIVATVEHLQSTCPQVDFLVINDCSTDHSADILRAHHYPFLDLPVNLGIGGGVQAGYLYAQAHDYDIAVQMDGDGQHLPAYLDCLIAPLLADKADFVVGSRYLEHEGFQSSWLRRAGGSLLSRWLRMLTGITVRDVTSGFRAVNRKGIALFAAEYAQDYPEPEALTLAALRNLRILEVPVRMRERSGGHSSISGVRSVYYMIKVTLALLVTKMANKRK